MLRAVSRIILASALAVGAVAVTSETAGAGSAGVRVTDTGSTGAASAAPASPVTKLGGCNWATPCGEAQNSSPWGMHITTTLGSGPHWCDVWNINGGSSPAWLHEECTPQYLGPGGHHGGGNVDVDAFTFNDRGYYMTFQTRVWHGPGVWTKITNLQTAECRNNGGVPDCWIS